MKHVSLKPLAIGLGAGALAMMAFILVHGMQPSANSWGESDVVAQALAPIMGPLYQLADAMWDGLGCPDLLDYGEFVRKCAHFTVYCLFAALCAAATAVQAGRVLSPYVWADLFIVLATAVADEFLQSFVDRSSMVTDVLLDFTGAVVGIAVVLAIYALASRRFPSARVSD